MGVGDGRPDPAAVRRALENDFRIIMRFWDCPKVTIAAAHGYCLGSAMELALACDLTLAAEDCRFGMPEVRFGSGIVTMLLPWLAGPKQAQLPAAHGRRSRQRRARCRRWGSSIASSRRRDCSTRRCSSRRRIAANDALAVKLTKQAINRSLDVAGLRAALAQALEIDVHDRDVRDAPSRGNSTPS